MSLCKRKIFRPLIICIHHYYIQNKVNKPYNFCQLQEYVLDIKNSLRGSGSLKEDFATVRWHNNKLFWSGRTYQLRNLLFGKFRQCKIFLQNLMCMSFCISCRNAIFTTKFKGFNCLHVFYNFCQIWYLLFFYFISVEWDIQWFPVSSITTSLARKRPFLWISKKRRHVKAAWETSKFHILSLRRRRYMAGILSIRCKTQIINQSYAYIKSFLF